MESCGSLQYSKEHATDLWYFVVYLTTLFSDSDYTASKLASILIHMTTDMPSLNVDLS
jgi:hypothetical protein